MITLLSKISFFQRLIFFSKHNIENCTDIPLKNLLFFLCEVTIISLLYTMLQLNLGTISGDFLELLSTNIYFSIITMSTVGYGDISPTNNLERAFTIIFMVGYLNARFIYTVTQIIKLLKISYDLKKIGRWFNMRKNHVVLYCDVKTISKNNFDFLDKFISEKRKSKKYKNSMILIINNNQEENAKLIELFNERGDQYSDVEFNNIRLNEKGFFDKINIKDASRVYVLADENDDRSDSDVFDFVYRVDKETDYNNGITAEIVNDNNRERTRKHGADVILRPSRSNPELLITATIAKGSGTFIEEIQSRGNSSIERFSINREMEFKWAELSYELHLREIGTVDAAIVTEGNMETTKANPKGTTIITNCCAILIQIHDMRNKDYKLIQNEIDKALEKIRIK